MPITFEFNENTKNKIINSFWLMMIRRSIEKYDCIFCVCYLLSHDSFEHFSTKQYLNVLLNQKYCAK